MITSRESARLIYRAYDPDIDAQFLLHVTNTVDTWDLANTQSKSIPRGKAFLKAMNGANEGALISVVACLKPNNLSSMSSDSESSRKQKETPVGFLALRSSDPKASQVKDRNFELGITFSNDFKGHGYGLEGLQWLLYRSSYLPPSIGTLKFTYSKTEAFKDLNVHRVHLTTYLLNTRALKTYERCVMYLLMDYDL